MEASYGPGATPVGPGPGREADVAPAPVAPAATSGMFSWVPADPAPLGLAGFALTTFILGMVNANAIASSDVPIVLSVAAAYGGLAQLLAGMWAFAERNTFAATAFSSYGAFWISFVFLEQFFLPAVAKHNPTALPNGVALYLLCWGFFTFYMWIASFRVSVAVNLVLLTLTAAYGVLGAGAVSGNVTVTHWGGYVTIACACLAWYTSLALVINRTLERVVLPVIPLTRPIGGARAR